MLIIAHRGASGQLPEHTLPAKALAHAQGADFLEQDIVLSRDGVPIVLHDLYLDTVTDVAARFPRRARADRRFHALDFDLDELRSLRCWERFDPRSRQAIFPGRFPPFTGTFSIPTLAEEIELTLRLNARTGRRTGIYPELKGPALHQAQGKDLATATLEVLAHYPLQELGVPVFLQCFDPATLLRLRQDLGVSWPLVQLIADCSWHEAEADFDFLRTAAGLDAIATWAEAIGPALHHLVEVQADGKLASTGLAEAARARGLAVHAYTLRADALPPGAPDHDTLLRWLRDELGLDAIFTDFPGRARQVLGGG